MAFEVAGVIIAEELVTTLAADAALELMPLAFESFAPELISTLAPEAFAGFGGETLASLFGNQAVPAALAESFTPAAQSVLSGGIGAGEGITALTPGALETGAALPEVAETAAPMLDYVEPSFATIPDPYADQFIEAFQNPDASLNGPSPYESLASNTETQLVPKSTSEMPTQAELNGVNNSQGLTYKGQPQFTPDYARADVAGYTPGQYANAGNPNLPSTMGNLNPNITAPINTVVPSSSTGLGNMAGMTQPANSGFLQGFSDFASKNPFLTGVGIYGIASATGMLNQKPQTFGQQNTQTTFNNPYKFSPNFKGSHPDPSQYWYTPKGPGYAGGGITQASPTPSMMQSGPADVNFMGSDMYPTSQQHRSFYATPTQMPTSAQEAMASYEPKTNPLTGQMMKNMASGGIAGYADGGKTGFAEGVTTTLTPLQKLVAQYNDTGAVPTQDEYLGSMGLHTSHNPDYYFDKANAKFVPVSSVPPMEQQAVAGPSSDGSSTGAGGGYAGGSMPNELKYASGGIAHYYRGELATSTGGRGDVYGATSRFLDMYDPAARYQAPSGTPDVGIFHDTNPSTRDKTALQASQIRNKAIANRANVRTGANYMQPSRQMGQLSFAMPGAKDDKDSDSDQVLTGASGGIMGASLGGYAAGGNPRLLRGPGDGMSDDIPASIGDRQPARLADGEFVVPADVVSHLGNGSTEAGAKKLHGMMDKVRVDRTGTKKQAPAVKANKYIPK
jgi:hypothetical protein